MFFYGDTKIHYYILCLRSKLIKLVFFKKLIQRAIIVLNFFFLYTVWMITFSMFSKHSGCSLCRKIANEFLNDILVRWKRVSYRDDSSLRMWMTVYECDAVEIILYSRYGESVHYGPRILSGNLQWPCCVKIQIQIFWIQNTEYIIQNTRYRIQNTE